MPKNVYIPARHEQACRVRKRVVVVDDSRTMRALIANVLKQDPRLEVVGEANDPYEAREAIRALRPDVITLDVEMPRMNGLSFLERLMRLFPTPVVMISAETHAGTKSAIEALALGAVDCVGKPAATRPFALLDLADRVYVAACAKIERPAVVKQQEAPPFQWNGKGVLIGASTGGVEAIERVLHRFPKNGPPVLIAQHMPASFLASFADRLQIHMNMSVALASEGAPLLQGHVYLAPGGDYHLGIDGSPASGRCRLILADKRNGHRPSVDVLFESARTVAPDFVAILLTGMGRDGAEGMRLLRNNGSYTLAQDQSSCVVYGMPRVADELGGVIETLPLDLIGLAVLQHCTKGASRD